VKKKAAVPEPMTPDGFTKMRVTLNLSMPCVACGEKPSEFYWKPVRGEKTIVFCIGCKRILPIDK
jgi:hypothetical protein